jgi:hypothetical protein
MVELQAVVSTDCTYLCLQHQNTVLEVDVEFEDLFDGVLNDWNAEPIFFELKEDVNHIMACHI